MIVLKYIMNKTRRFVTFVANRVAAIRQESTPSQWWYVRSELNPADNTSREIQASKTNKLERLNRGPKFVWQLTEDWSAQALDLNDGLDENKAGVKAEKIVVGGTSVKDEVWDDLLKWFSTWEKLRKVRWCARIRQYLQRSPINFIGKYLCFGKDSYASTYKFHKQSESGWKTQFQCRRARLLVDRRVTRSMAKETSQTPDETSAE